MSTAYPCVSVYYLSVPLLRLLLCSFLVLYMQAGFGALEAGAVRTKNVRSIIIKNLVDMSIGAISFYLVVGRRRCKVDIRLTPR